jgi:hypothetical protein
MGGTPMPLLGSHHFLCNALGNNLGVRHRRHSLGQGDRDGGGPAAYAAKGNAGPANFSAGLRAD